MAIALAAQSNFNLLGGSDETAEQEEEEEEYYEEEEEYYDDYADYDEEEDGSMQKKGFVSDFIYATISHTDLGIKILIAILVWPLLCSACLSRTARSGPSSCQRPQVAGAHAQVCIAHSRRRLGRGGRTQRARVALDSQRDAQHGGQG